MINERFVCKIYIYEENKLIYIENIFENIYIDWFWELLVVCFKGLGCDFVIDIF